MSDVNVQLVRECFELNHYHVMTCWEHDSAGACFVEPGLQLVVENSSPSAVPPSDFVLQYGDLTGIERALVEIRAWHADRFYSSVIEANPVLTQVASEESVARARHVFDGAPFTTILVISELPPSAEVRARSIGLLRDSGIGHVLEFPTVLQELLEKISIHGAYLPSDTLQTLRLLKRYRFIRDQQLEFAFPTEPRVPSPPLPVETAVADDGADEDSAD